MIKTRGWKLGLSLVVLAGAVLVSGVAFADHESGQVAKEDWVARYEGSANSNLAYALTLDSQGNVYVTGESYTYGTGYDYATVKYNPQGEEAWVARYNGPKSSYDTAYALAIDSQGNVYVTGTSYGAGTAYDYATVKYDPNGNQLWESRYNGSGNGYDIAYALALDSQGNVCVTGYSLGEGTSNDSVTIKYDPLDGHEVWVARYNGPVNSSDSATALVIDSQDNVYVTGYSYGAGTSYDYLTIQYDPNGNQLWESRYNGLGNGEDKAYALALDSQGNVYVTGLSYGNGTDYDYVTIKYDLQDEEGWVVRYNGSGNGYDSARDLVIDSQDNVYVTGLSYGNGTYGDCFIIKYDSADGHEVWGARYNSPSNYSDWSNAIAVDSQDNVYITGRTGTDETYGDYVTIKYDPEGKEIWLIQYNGGITENDANAIAIDSQDNVYVTGQSGGMDGGWDYATIKYLQLPTVSIDLQESDDVLHRGENLEYQLTLTNNSDRDQIINYWSQVKDREGSLREAVAPTPITLGPNEIYTTDYSHAIPGKSPKGQYEYIGNVGEDVDHLWDEDTFTFNIVPPGIFDLNLKEGAR